MATRKKEKQRNYRNYRKNKDLNRCDFCEFSEADKAVVKEYGNFWIVENSFSYDVWDNMGVTEHLMIVPKGHVESIYELNQPIVAEFGKIISDYDKLGYSFYARASENKTKSVPHQHTHLLKFDGKKKDLFVFIRKPYLLWFK